VTLLSFATKWKDSFVLQQQVIVFRLCIYTDSLAEKKSEKLQMSLFAKVVLLFCMLTLARAQFGTVKITNSLEGKENLNIRCQSKDNDLGHHLLHFNQSFKWDLGTHVFWRTLFFCSCRWGNGPVLHFEAYNQNRDASKCLDCFWYIHKDGPCRYELKEYTSIGESRRDKIIRKCYKWKKWCVSFQLCTVIYYRKIKVQPIYFIYTQLTDINLK